MEEYDKRVQIDLNTKDIISQINFSNENTVKCLQNYHRKIISLNEQLEKTNQDLKKKEEDHIRLEAAYHQECDKSNTYTAKIAQRDSQIEQLSASIKEFKNSVNENNKNYEKAQEKCKELASENDTLKKQLASSQLDNDQLTKQVNIITIKKSEIEAELRQANDVLAHYRSLKMDKLNKAYTLFISFKDRTRNNLKAVFETDTFLGFISNSMQWERIAGIWEQTKRKIVNDDTEDLQELRELFLILFETYNAGYSEAPYELINPVIDSKYNSNEQLIKNQKSDGKISKILLEGYVFKKTNAIHKAMILVE